MAVKHDCRLRGLNRYDTDDMIRQIAMYKRKNAPV
jgi:hypothetical protein